MASRVDGQITGLSGELFVAAELLKRGLQTSVTFGNAKSIDLLAYNSETQRTFTVQVKALRSNNYFLLSPAKVNRAHVYVFVVLNRPGQAVEYFIVPGADLADTPQRFGKAYYQTETMPGVLPSTLRKLGYQDAWEPFSQPAPPQR